jgi:hypothetical protein
MRNSLQGRVGLIAKLLLLSLMVLSVLPSGCSQGGILECEVHYKYVTGMKDLLYFIIVTNEPTDSQPSIVFDPTAEEEIKGSLPSAGNLVVDDSSATLIETSYTDVYYTVSIHVMSGNDYKYYLSCRTTREIFNDLTMGARMKVETEPSDVGPKIVRIVE